MPQIEIAGIHIGQCTKPGCIRFPTQRHHMGCEAMWLRHFRLKRRTARYRKFKERYQSFHAEDVTRLCVWHHEEIHVRYLPIIKRYVRLWGYPTDWTWEQAEKLIKRLREECQKWLLTETPGMKPSERRTVLQKPL